MAQSECLHHSSEEELTNMSALKYLYLPEGSKKVVNLDDSSSIAS